MNIAAMRWSRAQAPESVLPSRAFVHAAGFMRVGELGSLDLAAVRTCGDKRRRGDAACRHAGTKSSQRGRIVLIGSRTASGAAGRGQYVATKSALNGMARSWATELARESDLAQQQLNHIGRL